MDSYVRLVFTLYEPSSHLYQVGLVSNVGLKFIGNYSYVYATLEALFEKGMYQQVVMLNIDINNLEIIFVNIINIER